ncbi:MAG TPA: ASKHA domain-containing protein [Clostridiales bacterium]|nr:ASKHA domain-containing protein [Clostridiales bacterium]
MEKIQVTIMPEGHQVEVEKGSTLLDAANAAGITMKTSCGGQGTCGRCAVKVLNGAVQGGDGNLSKTHKAEGYILACTATVDEGPVTVDFPESSRLSEHQVLLDDNVDDIIKENRTDDFEDTEAAFVKKVQVTLTEPNLMENASDFARLSTELRGILETEHITISYDALKTLPLKVREQNWQVTVTCLMQEDAAEIIRVEAGLVDTPPYGIALDIGTTTIAVALVDLATGKKIHQNGTFNRQASMGDDVISRIVYTEEEKFGLRETQSIVIETINGLLDEVYEAENIRPEEVSAMMVAANTTMIHLFLGIEPKFIRREPYIPASAQFPVIKGKELGIHIHVDGAIYCFPAVASYVGGDIVSGALLTGLEKQEEFWLFIDIGTNGEMVLGNSDLMMCCACSAGPAFEGGGITFGMRAMAGAIEKIVIDDDFKVSYVTVNNAPAVGICGSGLIDCLFTLRKAGIINRQGKMQEVATDRMRQGEEGPEFVLVRAEESGNGKDIVITEADVENLIRAKAAVFAGIRVMLLKMELPIEAISKILIGGGFGNYLNLKDSIQIGLLPDLPAEYYDFIGNSSLKGAYMALLSRKVFEHSVELGKGMTYLELSDGNEFYDEYVQAMFLPHTDMSLFPSVED